MSAEKEKADAEAALVKARLEFRSYRIEITRLKVCARARVWVCGYGCCGWVSVGWGEDELGTVERDVESQTDVDSGAGGRHSCAHASHVNPAHALQDELGTVEREAETGTIICTAGQEADELDTVEREAENAAKLAREKGGMALQMAAEKEALGMHLKKLE
eukprot:scaffold201801_cov17-Tisochrysis_lutea.AAC.1